MSKPTDKDQVTDASAVELEEDDLDQAQGGASFLKLGDIDGESLRTLKLDDRGFKVEINGIDKISPDLKAGIRVPRK